MKKLTSMTEQGEETNIPEALRDKSGDWIEDATHENGQYQCFCYRCQRIFIGLKRRVKCRACANSSNNSSSSHINHIAEATERKPGDLRVEAAPVDAGNSLLNMEEFSFLTALDRCSLELRIAVKARLLRKDTEIARLRASLESMRERAEKAEARGLELEQAVSAHICNTCYRWNCCEHDTGCPKITSAEKENA